MSLFEEIDSIGEPLNSATWLTISTDKYSKSLILNEESICKRCGRTYLISVEDASDEDMYARREGYCSAKCHSEHNGIYLDEYSLDFIKSTEGFDPDTRKVFEDSLQELYDQT